MDSNTNQKIDIQKKYLQVSCMQMIRWISLETNYLKMTTLGNKGIYSTATLFIETSFYSFLGKGWMTYVSILMDLMAILVSDCMGSWQFYC